jgi:hypothetical protein
MSFVLGMAPRIYLVRKIYSLSSRRVLHRIDERRKRSVLDQALPRCSSDYISHDAVLLALGSFQSSPLIDARTDRP